MFSMKEPTQRQGEVLEFIRGAAARGDSAPTYREISKKFDFNSPKAAYDHVVALERKGLVRRQRGKSRGIKLMSLNETASESTVLIPVLGNVAAGGSVEQTQELEGQVQIDRALLGRADKAELFAVHVRGDSMTGCGIFDGDLVVAESKANPRHGDVVVALIDKESTVKTLDEKDGHFVLKPENPRYPVLVPSTELVIQGVVRVLVRRVG